MALQWIQAHAVDDGRWKPFAWSAAITGLVAGIHTGVIDAVMVTVMSAQHLGS